VTGTIIGIGAESGEGTGFVAATPSYVQPGGPRHRDPAASLDPFDPLRVALKNLKGDSARDRWAACPELVPRLSLDWMRTAR
jgi:hypothetical protein